MVSLRRPICGVLYGGLFVVHLLQKSLFSLPFTEASLRVHLGRPLCVCTYGGLFVVCIYGGLFVNHPVVHALRMAFFGA